MLIYAAPVLKYNELRFHFQNYVHEYIINFVVLCDNTSVKIFVEYSPTIRIEFN